MAAGGLAPHHFELDLGLRRPAGAGRARARRRCRASGRGGRRASGGPGSRARTSSRPRGHGLGARLRARQRSAANGPWPRPASGPIRLDGRQGCGGSAGGRRSGRRGAVAQWRVCGRRRPARARPRARPSDDFHLDFGRRPAGRDLDQWRGRMMKVLASAFSSGRPLSWPLGCARARTR